MKPNLCCLVCVLLLAPPLASQAVAEFAVRDAPTQDELTERRQQERARDRAPQEVPGVREAGEIESRVLTNPSILNQALILGDGRLWTVLPQRAILHSPDLGRSAFAHEATGRLATWSEFEAANRSRIQGYVVRESHLAGTDQIPESLKEQWSRSNRMIVSVYRGNPVALPNAEPAEDSTAESPEHSISAPGGE